MANYPVKLLKDKDGTAFIPVVNSDSIITPEGNTLNDLLEEKQDLLTSGINIKTVNNTSLLGAGNISIQGAKGDTGDSGVYIGTSAPTDSDKSVWIDTDDSSSITIPTKTSDLTNDSGFIDNTVNNLVNYTTTSDLNTSLNNIEDGIEDVDGRIDDIDDKLNGNDIAGDMVVESIRTKNMFDGTSLVLGSIAGTQFDKRISSRQALYLEPGTYTFSCNIASTYRFGLMIRPVPPPNNEDASWDSGWITDTSTYTFTIVTGGYFGVNLSRTDNEVFTTTDINNLLGYNYQLEKGSTETSFSYFQNLNAALENINLYSTTEQTIGTWIDGKPIYRKVYQFTTPSTENSWESMGQTGANIETVVDFRGTVLDTGLRKYNSINFGEGSYYIHTAVDAGNNRYINMIQKGWSSLPCVIIIEYTKTAD